MVGAPPRGQFLRMPNRKAWEKKRQAIIDAEQLTRDSSSSLFGKVDKESKASLGLAEWFALVDRQPEASAEQIKAQLGAVKAALTQMYAVPGDGVPGPWSDPSVLQPGGTPA